VWLNIIQTGLTSFSGANIIQSGLT